MACKAAGIPRRTAYAHKEKDKAFAAAWDDALNTGTTLLKVGRGTLTLRHFRRRVSGLLKRSDVVSPCLDPAGLPAAEIRAYSLPLALKPSGIGN